MSNGTAAETATAVTVASAETPPQAEAAQTAPAAVPPQLPPLPALPERPRPLPDGWTEESLREVMATIRLDDSEEDSLGGYLADAYWRFLHTWGLVRNERGRALELGSNPYFITWLLQQFTELEVDQANYFGFDTAEHIQHFAYTDTSGTVHRQMMRSAQFNLERDRFPYDDGTFDVVLFCEIIEHLQMDPMHALREIHRVLAPGGLVVITTPNVARIGNVLSLVAGENIYDPYSGYGPYGRHNREYTLHELVHLLRFAGFAVAESFTADAHAESYAHRFAYDEVVRTVAFRRFDLGQYLFVAARSIRPPGTGLPDFLYRSWPGNPEMVDVFAPGQA